MIDFIYLFLTKPRRKIGEDRKRHNGVFTYKKKKKKTFEKPLNQE
jgi:hypothetical protein